MYGPVRTVVWEGRSRKAPPYPDLWQILLQKSFWGGERKFLEPLMRFACDEMRDHIVLHKNDHGPRYRSYRALQQ